MNKSALEHRKEIARSFHGGNYGGNNYIGDFCCDAARLIRSHAPEGRNYTNLEYVTLRSKYHELLEFVVKVSETADIDLDMLPFEAKKVLESQNNNI